MFDDESAHIRFVGNTHLDIEIYNFELDENNEYEIERFVLEEDDE